MKRIIFVVALLGAAHPVPALDAWDNTKAYANKALFWKDKSTGPLGFHTVFPKPIYQKSYFGFALTGAAIVVGGALTYFTAGAGAPVAGWGVGGVASWVGGGGAGSYMAGLSTVGGWFGGNAMLGSAILNGISIGVAGSGTSFASLTAIGKVGVMAAVTASALDGVILFQNPKTKNLSYRIRLTVPQEIGSKGVRELAKQLRDAEASLLDAAAGKDEKSYGTLYGRKKYLLNWAVTKGQAALKKGASNEDLMVLGIVANNANEFDLFDKLVKKIQVLKVDDTGYVDYLKSVAAIERGDAETATNLLWKSWRLNPYAVEQPLLLVNILGHEKFEAREEEIRTIVEKATKDFDSDKYAPSYSLVSLDYRLATMYLIHKKYALAETYYEKAYDKLAMLQKHLGDKSMKKAIRMGIANAMYGQNRKAEAKQLLEKILKDAKTNDETSFLRSQYAGNL